MTVLRVAFSRLWGLLTRRPADHALNEEIRTHLELLAHDLEAQGLSREQAKHRARREFGSVTVIREEAQDERGLPLVETFLQDAVFGLRQLRRAPGFALGAAATLALGIAATTVVFSWVSAILSGAVQIRDMDRLVGVWLHNRAQGEMKTVVAPADIALWRERQQPFEQLTAQRDVVLDVGGAGATARVQGSAVLSDYFSVFSAQPFIGRAFSLTDEQLGAAPVAVLGYRFWMDRFGGQASVVGTTLRLDDVPTVVVGVLPKNDYSPDIVMPLHIDANAPDYRERTLFVAARMKPGVTLESARAAMASLGAEAERSDPDRYRGWSINTQPLQEEFVGSQARRVFVLLAAAAAIVLLIGCANMANVMLARGVARTRELAVRTALGGTRWRLVRQLLVEGSLVAIGGGLGGALLARWGLQTLRAVFSAGAPYMERAVLSTSALGWAVVATAASTILFALAPAWMTTEVIPSTVLREGAHGTTSVRSKRLRKALVGSEVAMAACLMVVAVLVGRSLVAIQGIAPGFDPDHVLTLRMTIAPTRYGSDNSVADFYARVLARVREVPGVVDAGATTRIPAAGGRFNPNRTVAIEGRAPSGNDTWFANDLTIAPGYLETLRVPVRQGRLLTTADAATTPLVAIVSETMARRYWAGSTAIGSHIRLGDEPDGQWRTVVGIVGDVRNDDVDAPPAPHVYVPLAQRATREMTIVVRTVDDPLRQVAALRAAVSAVDTDQPLYDVKTLTQVLADDLRGSVVLVGLAGLFAAIALVLAATGIYGIVAHGVAQDTREIGIHLALGSTRWAVVTRVARDGLKPVAVGLAIGTAAGAAASTLLAGALYGVSSADPANYLLTLAILAFAAALACVVPAVRAARTDPLTALRCE